MFPAGPEQEAQDQSVPRRTSTAGARSQCYPRGPNSKHRIRVFPAGPQMQAVFPARPPPRAPNQSVNPAGRQPQRISEDIPERISDRMAEYMPDRVIDRMSKYLFMYIYIFLLAYINHNIYIYIHHIYFQMVCHKLCQGIAGWDHSKKSVMILLNE